MFVLGLPSAMAVAALYFTGPGEAEAERLRDRAALVATIDNTRLDVWQRSVGLTVRADARSVGDGCTTAIASQYPGQSDAWTRLLRWDQVAWSGTLADGRVMVAFFEQDGRLANDRVTFAPADATAFQAGVARVAQSCRAGRARQERVIVADYPLWRSCYLARTPAVELVETRSLTGRAEEPRASMSVYARETPEAELHLLFDGDPDTAEVSFTIARSDLRRMGVAGAAFALDETTVDPRHSLAFYGDTRLRIRMDPFSMVTPAATTTEPSYFERLTDSRTATLTLVDAARKPIGRLTFDIGSALTEARETLRATPWTCAAPAPAPTPAAQFHLAP